MKLNQARIYEVLRQLFPNQNDFSVSDYSEELKELLDFDITTKTELLDLLIKHRESVLAIDQSDMDDYHIRFYSKEYGKEYVEERIKNKYWFAYPGLLRIALELEFGEKYIEYAKKRDDL